MSDQRLVILPKDQSEIDKLIQFCKQEDIEYWVLVDKDGAPTLTEVKWEDLNWEDLF